MAGKKKKKRKNTRSYVYTIGAILLSVALLLLFVNPSFFREKPKRTIPEQTAPLRKDARVIFSENGTDAVKATIDVQIAQYENERMHGLMFRESLDYGEGMLFIFEKPELRSFWMKNTFIPLDIIYLDENRKIINIHHMTEPLSTASIRSDGPAQYVVETIGGFCKAKGIAEGDHIRVERYGN